MKERQFQTISPELQAFVQERCIHFPGFPGGRCEFSPICPVLRGLRCVRFDAMVLSTRSLQPTWPAPMLEYVAIAKRYGWKQRLDEKRCQRCGDFIRPLARLCRQCRQWGRRESYRRQRQKRRTRRATEAAFCSL